MATVKKGILTPAGEWWKHLRWTKRPFWKRERRAAKDNAMSAEWDYERRAEDAMQDDETYWPARDGW